MSFSFKEYFRPCIDVHLGKVKQIVGATLTSKNMEDIENDGGIHSDPQPHHLQENFVGEQKGLYFAERYADYKLTGGHIIMLDHHEKTLFTTQEIIASYPHSYQVGGGMSLNNGKEWISRGAEKIIVSSCLFEDGCFQEKYLERLSREWGADKLVVDLSAVSVAKKYRVAIHGWKTVTDLVLSSQTLDKIGHYCQEILVHAIAHEGLKGGMDENLFTLLEENCSMFCVYAGGVHSLEEVKMVCERSYQRGGNIGFTIGSSLDLFGGDIALSEVLKLTHQYHRSSPK